uniref:VWFA domain-containing protein n=1 Tax=Panagrolaimus superbus TaxID=310955 RepID=A0A914XV82_9BILA
MCLDETMNGEEEGIPDSWYVFGSPFWGTTGDRPNVPNVVIVISGIDSSPVTAATQALLTKGINVFSIGFADLPMAQLQAISGSPSRSFSTTPENLASVIKNICAKLN